ncbi:hypothetical protein FKM82_015365 [Ascaphus truei]
MDTDLLKCVQTITKVFRDNSADGIKLTGEEITKTIKVQFGAVLANPINPAVAKELVAKAEAYSQEGATFQVYVELLCSVCIEYYNGNVGLKG